MSTVLIVSHQQGFESDPIIDELRERNIPVFRYNQDDGAIVSSASSGIGEECSLSLTCDGKTLSGKNVSVAWFQQPPPYHGQPMNDAECLQRVTLETMNRAVFSSLGCPWFNSFDNVMLAGNKVLQLHAARAIGLPLMETLVSNQPAAIREFCAQGPTIAKNLATPWLAQGNKTTAAFAKLVQPSWLENDAELSFAPVIYQRFCERARDYRVVAVGGKYYSVCCTPTDGQKEDVRRSDHTGEGYETCELDRAFTSKLEALMDRLGIDYCSADFMEDSGGNIYFLEANICGAWWWVDRYYNGEICRSITEQIIRKM